MLGVDGGVRAGGAGHGVKQRIVGDHVAQRDAQAPHLPGPGAPQTGAEEEGGGDGPS